MRYDRDPELANILSIQLEEANNIVRNAQSERLKTIFQEVWYKVDHGSVSANVHGERLEFDASLVMDVINKWIRNLRICQESAINKYYAIENPTSEDFTRKGRIEWDVYDLIIYYEELKSKVDSVEMEFANAVRYYRSPLRQSLTDMRIIYNSMKNVKGDFSGFENVSVYIHGIESTGDEFLESAMKAASAGDVIVYEDRDGNKEYYLVYFNQESKDIDFLERDELTPSELDTYKMGRLHIIYETEHENEHRQETSDDLAIKLTEMGLMGKSTLVDMFAHSYGGRRSFQFAIDYPDKVRSISTIGTPYDTNKLAKTANKLPWEWIGKLLKKEPSEYSNYLDFNLENKREDKGIDHSNAYTDLSTEPLHDDINSLRVANPEVYRKLDEMEITAVAGYRLIFKGSSYNPGIRETTSDDVVSIDSQQGNLLGSIIDIRLKYEVKGVGLLYKQGHNSETVAEDFIELIRNVNLEKMGVGNNYE